MRVLLLVIFLAGLSQEVVRSATASAAERQRLAAERQHESVRRQAGSAQGASFFQTPWLTAAPPPFQTDPAGADCEPLPPNQLEQLIADAAKKEGVKAELIRSVIRRESGGRPCAVSERGAQGLMQIMPGTAAYLGLTDPFDPAANIAAGTRYLSEMLSRFKGDLRLALGAYNAGPQRVEAGGAVPDIPETKAYVEDIIADVAPKP